MEMELVALEIEDYDVIWGMNWLSKYRTCVNCYHKMVTIWLEDGMSYTFQGEWLLDMLSFVSCAKVQRWLKKGYVAWIIVVGEEETSEVNIHEVPIANEFLDVFPEELPRLSPDQEVEFNIILLLCMKLIFIPPYRMAPTKLKELKEQLQDPLDKGSIQMSTSPGEL